jgi:hypothetical protein
MVASSNQQETVMDTQNQEINLLTEDDLERINGGQADLGAARACCNVALTFALLGSSDMRAYFLGMACGYGWC